MSDIIVTVQHDGRTATLTIPADRAELALDGAKWYTGQALGTGEEVTREECLCQVMVATTGDIGEGYNRDVLRIPTPAGAVRQDMTQACEIIVEEAVEPQ